MNPLWLIFFKGVGSTTIFWGEHPSHHRGRRHRLEELQTFGKHMRSALNSLVGVLGGSTRYTVLPTYNIGIIRSHSKSCAKSFHMWSCELWKPTTFFSWRHAFSWLARFCVFCTHSRSFLQLFELLTVRCEPYQGPRVKIQILYPSNDWCWCHISRPGFLTWFDTHNHA